MISWIIIVLDSWLMHKAVDLPQSIDCGMPLCIPTTSTDFYRIQGLFSVPVFYGSTSKISRSRIKILVSFYPFLLMRWRAQAHGLLQSIELRASKKEESDKSIAAAKRFLERITGLTTFICYDFPLEILETLAHYHQGSLKHLQFCYTRCGGQARLNRGELLQYSGLRFPENPDDEVQSIFNKIDRVVEWFPHLESLGLNRSRSTMHCLHCRASKSYVT